MFLSLLLALTLAWCPPAASDNGLPKGFVYVVEAVPGICVELRYYTDHNFIGERIDGYLAPRCILAEEAAVALGRVQEELSRFGLGLKIYDAYRPQRAVNHFVRWAEDLKDVRMKKEFYPYVDKENLFSDGYIAKKSGHSRGGTVDLTIVSLDARPPGAELDMGSAFDYFGPQSWPESPEIGPGPRAHRMLLQEVMKKHGFKPYSKEWWHFTLELEPYPETYFDFPVR
ncbi:MAG: M15 family metallopeptidase [Syntrophobacteraceae bacterium]